MMGNDIERTILHVDMDAFFASVEIRDNPKLAGLPVVVGGSANSRGVIAAASYEARKYGIHSAMSSRRALALCPDVVFVSGRHGRYAEVSREIFTIFESYTPLVEGLSIDEAFLDVTGVRRIHGDGPAIGRAIKQRIKAEVGLTASVGVAPNKFLAKLASDLEKPDGLVVIGAEEAIARLAPLPVGRLWGVGPVMQKELAKYGIEKVGHIQRRTVEELETIAGSFAGALHRMAHGLDDRPVVTGSQRKSISEETTFARDISDRAELHAVLDELAETVGRRLRAKSLAARTVQIKYRFPDFTTRTRAMTLPSPTTSTRSIRDTARGLFDAQGELAGRALRLVGVGVSNLEPDGGGQVELFPEPNAARDGRLDTVLDKIQGKYGDPAITHGLRRKHANS